MPWPVSAVTTVAGGQPMLASVSRSDCTPVPGEGSEGENATTMGGESDIEPALAREGPAG